MNNDSQLTGIRCPTCKRVIYEAPYNFYANSDCAMCLWKKQRAPAEDRTQEVKKWTKQLLSNMGRKGP